MSITIGTQSLQQPGLLLKRFSQCHSRTFGCLAQRAITYRRSTQKYSRCASTLSSQTAINATKPVPNKLRSLYDALIEVRRTASTHINTSRLHLALQGLESGHPTVRLAVLGIDTPDTARRLVRLLLADPLEDAGHWESQLTGGDEDYSRGLILRYGQPANHNVPRPQNSIPILYVPCAILERHNIEILISIVSKPDAKTLQPISDTPADMFLSPVVGTPTSFHGRQTIISQPVHRCLLVVQGLEELIEAAKLLARTRFSTVEDRDSLRIAVHLADAKVSTERGTAYAFDMQMAEDGLAVIRRSITQAPDYEHKWMKAGIPVISEWVAAAVSSRASADSSVPRPVEDLIRSVLESALHDVESAESTSRREAAERSLDPAQRFALEQAIDEFSRAAHQELQAGLASAWSSRNWRKMAWYKLFWRVDDVGLIVTDLVSNSWLPRTERAAYELSGRMIQAGINPVMESELDGRPQASNSIGADMVPPAVSSIPVVLDPASQLASVAVDAPSTEPVIKNTCGTAVVEIQPTRSSIPITTMISNARLHFVSEAITSLTSTAQQLVFRTLSITGLTGGLSALTYFSTLSGTMYEAGTIAAVGTVFALWRMQGGWQSSTKRLEDDLFAEGRSVVVDIVSRMKALVDTKAMVIEDDAGRRSIDTAKRSILNAQTELEHIKTSLKPTASVSPAIGSPSKP